MNEIEKNAEFSSDAILSSLRFHRFDEDINEIYESLDSKTIEMLAKRQMQSEKSLKYKIIAVDKSYKLQKKKSVLYAISAGVSTMVVLYCVLKNKEAINFEMYHNYYERYRDSLKDYFSNSQIFSYCYFMCVGFLEKILEKIGFAGILISDSIFVYLTTCHSKFKASHKIQEELNRLKKFEKVDLIDGFKKS